MITKNIFSHCPQWVRSCIFWMPYPFCRQKASLTSIWNRVKRHFSEYAVYQDLRPWSPGALRHGSKVTSVTLPSRYTFPSVLRTKTRVVEDSVSGSSWASTQYDIYWSTSRPSPSSRFESTRITTPCRSLAASSVSTVNLNRCPTFMTDCIVFNRLFWFANDNTSAMVDRRIALASTRAAPRFMLQNVGLFQPAW